MEIEGKYIYCIIGTEQERNFGPIGIGDRGDEVLTIGYSDLSMVVSNHLLTKFRVDRENLLSHERVIEEVMKEFDSVLPVRYGTIASNSDEVRNLLDRRYREFKNALMDMDHKVELGVKGIWKNMDIIFKEIVEENREIQRLRQRIQNSPDQNNIQPRLEVSRIVKQVLAEKKKREAKKFLDILRRISFDSKINETIGDEMFMNAAFLVAKGREKEFDNLMEDLSEEYEDRIKFMYAGPLPVFNFVNIVIYPEEWEK